MLKFHNYQTYCKQIMNNFGHQREIDEINSLRHDVTDRWKVLKEHCLKVLAVLRYFVRENTESFY
jgi:hypothetical protein